MPMQITFELSDSDLDYFRQVMISTREKTICVFRAAESSRIGNYSSGITAEMDGLDCHALTLIPAGTEISIDYG